MQRILALLLLTFTLAFAEMQIAPSGTYVDGTPQIAPDGSFVGSGQIEITPDGSYIAVDLEPQYDYQDSYYNDYDVNNNDNDD